MWPFAPKVPKKPLVYVGTVSFHTDLSDGKKITRTVQHRAALWMSEDNERKIYYSSSDPSDDLMSRHPYKATIDNWKKGGKFPTSGFDPEDSLGEMLNRMIDARILGAKK